MLLGPPGAPEIIGALEKKMPGDGSRGDAGRAGRWTLQEPEGYSTPTAVQLSLTFWTSGELAP